MKNLSLKLGFALATFSCSVFATQPSVIGKINFAKGSNAAQQPNESPRLLGKDAEVFQGDNIQTSDASFVVIGFVDGSKVTVRPNSNFKVDQFDNANKNVKFTVYEGGIRAATGEFAKEGANNFQIKTPTATLKGDKNSDYSVHVCKTDCEKNKKIESNTDVSVAKIVDIKGDVFAKNRVDENTDKRKLSIGGSLNVQDFLTTQANSYAVMVFRDNQKITLQANSEFDIMKYDFKKADKKDELLFKLVTGGMRALTGTIAKKDHSAYEMDTPVATIGIRGTDYDFQCNVQGGFFDDCENDGAYLRVNEGAVSEKNAAGEKVFYKDETGFVANKSSSPELKSIPKDIVDIIDSAPAAKNAPDADKVFGSLLKDIKAGTYTTVNKGNATLEFNDDDKLAILTADGGKLGHGSILTLSEGQNSFAGDAVVEILKQEEMPFVIANDEMELRAFANNTNIPTTTLFSMTINESTTQANNNAACLVE